MPKPDPAYARWALIALLLFAGAALAQLTADDAALEARVLRLAGQLRCLVCQNQTLADSNAELAVDLRTQIRERLRNGASDAEVMTFLVQRYGDFVLYRPPVKRSTLLLWFGPLLLLIAAVAALVAIANKRKRAVARGLSDAERQRADALLQDADISSR